MTHYLSLSFCFGGVLVYLLQEHDRPMVIVSRGTSEMQKKEDSKTGKPYRETRDVDIFMYLP